MFKKYIVPLLAVIGFYSALKVVFLGSATPPPAPIVIPPPRAPYEKFVAGTAIVESESENISLGVARSGVIDAVFVKAGDTVPKDGPLFSIDTRDLLAERAVREAKVKFYKAEVQQAKAGRDEANNLYERAVALRATNATSKEILDQRFYSLAAATATLAKAEAQQAVGEGELQQVMTDLDRSVIKAPFEGTVLQIRARHGAYATAGANSDALALFGSTERLRVRVDIDENDAWRFTPGEEATAYVRGNRDLSAQLKFIRVEPYVLPKRSLTGLSTERVDTRVLQVLYEITQKDFDLYVGQLLEVFIKQKS